MTTKELSPAQHDTLLTSLQARFEKNMQRHPGLVWATVQARLTANPAKCWSLQAMESSGGEPDVIEQDSQTSEVVFYDCAPETPAGRRSICYDRKALEARKANQPRTSAVDMATEMGIELLTEEQYRKLQTIGSFDTKTSSWLKTPADIRKLGGAIFADRRYNTVFVYHNGAESYYAGRGFRGALTV